LSVFRARCRVLLFAVAFLWISSPDAKADFLITPFVGTTFGGSTTLLFVDVEAVSSKHWTFGASAAWLSDQILGVEADFGTVPKFFQNSSGTSIVLSSRVTTIGGNVIAALPLSVTRESLRPYVTGGLGFMRASAEDIAGLNETGNWLGLQLGGGAIGMVSDRAGVRFDLRHSRALSRATTLLGEQRSKLSFWRATFGVTLRY